jgi:hypothetical protein
MAVEKIYSYNIDKALIKWDGENIPQIGLRL